MKDPRNFIIFLGNPGCGKTTFCSALLPWVVQNFKTYRVWNESKLLSRIRKDSFGDVQGDFTEFCKDLTDDEFVCLDDFGSCGPNEWRNQVLFELVDRRWSMKQATLITSNLNRQEIYEQYSAKMHSRLFDKRNTIIEDFTGVDHRLN